MQSQTQTPRLALDEPSWEAGLPGDWTLRASVGSAFRNPTIFELFSTFSFYGLTFAGNPDLSPEHDRSFEFGAEKRIGTRTDFDADYFQSNISNLIYYEPNLVIDPSGNYYDYVNAAQGRTSGLSYAITLVRQRWARVELKEMENLCELVLRARRGQRTPEVSSYESVRKA